MDGVIVDSEAQWKELEREFFRAMLPDWREEHHAEIVGMGVEDVYRHLTRKHGLEMTLADFLKRSDDVARRVYEEEVSLAPGFLSFLDRLKAAELPAALASSSPRRWIDLVLNRYKLAPRFSAIVSADDVGGRTKPLPDIYAEAVKRLGLSPAICVAVEDSAIGLASAKAAGLRAAGLRTPHNRDQDLSAADLLIYSFSGLKIADLA